MLSLRTQSCRVGCALARGPLLSIGRESVRLPSGVPPQKAHAVRQKAQLFHLVLKQLCTGVRKVSHDGSHPACCHHPLRSRAKPHSLPGRQASLNDQHAVPFTILNPLASLVWLSLFTPGHLVRGRQVASYAGNGRDRNPAFLVKMKPNHIGRVPKIRRSNEAAASSSKNNILSGKGSASVASTKGSLCKARSQGAPTLQDKDASTTCASSPRLSDASCSDSSASDRLSSTEIGIPPNKTTGPAQLLNTGAARVPAQSSTLLASGPMPYEQTLVLQGRVITGDLGIGRTVDDARNPLGGTITSPLSASAFQPIHTFQSRVSQSQEQLQVGAHPGAGHSGGTQERTTRSTPDGKAPRCRESFPLSQQLQPHHSPAYQANPAPSVGREQNPTAEKKPREHRSIRAFPQSLTTRKILTQLVRRQTRPMSKYSNVLNMGAASPLV